MANLIRSELRTEALARLGENTGFFTTANLNQWLQDGIDDVALQVEPLVTNATVDVVSGTSEYLLPTDLINIKQVWYGGTGAWANLTLTGYVALFDWNADWEDSTGTPSHWYWRQ